MRRLLSALGISATVTMAVALPTQADDIVQPYGAVGFEYASLGGVGGFLGQALSSETAGWYGGRFQTFVGGSIYWSAGSGAHEVHGGIRQAWANQQWEFGPLRYPVTDELHTPVRPGAAQFFQGGAVYWSASTGAHAVYGGILAKWQQTGWENVLGFPTADEYPFGAGRRQNFEHGTIEWTPTGGAVANYRFGTALYVGDSITTGFYADSRVQAFPALNAARYGAAIVSISKPGATLRTVAALTTVPAGLDLAVVELGTNDVLVGTSPATFASQYRALLARIRGKAPHAPVVCLGSWRSSSRALQGLLDGVIHDECVRAGGHPIGVVDLYSNPALHATAGRLTAFGVADGFHPGNAGHAAIAQRIYVTLR